MPLQVDLDAYKALMECVLSSGINVCETVPSGARRKGGAELTNSLRGAPHQVDGADRYEDVIIGLSRHHLLRFQRCLVIERGRLTDNYAMML